MNKLPAPAGPRDTRHPCPPHTLEQTAASNARAYAPDSVADHSTLDALREFYAPHNRELAKLLDDPNLNYGA